MKKILSLLLVISLAATMFVFPVVAAESSTTLQLNVSSLSLGVGETFTIATRTNSTGAISWRSSDTSVATVNSSGRISALKEGSATIRATVGGVSRDVTLTVRNAPTAIRADNVSVPRGSTAQIRLQFNKGSVSRNNTYKSSDTKIATVDKNGVVTGVSEGNCEITVTTYNNVTAIAKVTVTEAPEKRGNTTSNNSKGSTQAVFDGEMVYYSTYAGVFKMKPNGTGKTKISDDYGANLNIIDGYIYYTGNTNRGEMGIFRMNTSGGEKKKIIDSKSNIMYVSIVDDWIYYYAAADKTLFKAKLDGTGKKQLHKGGTLSNINVTDGWIYFSEDDGSRKYLLCKITVDGTKKTFLKNLDDENIVTQHAVVDGENIYYLAGGSIKRTGLNGHRKGIDHNFTINGNSVLVLSGGDIFVADGWIYYDNKGELCKVKVDGTGKKELFKSEYGFLNLDAVAGDWIFYRDRGDYMITIDGKNKQKY